MERDYILYKIVLAQDSKLDAQSKRLQIQGGFWSIELNSSYHNKSIVDYFIVMNTDPQRSQIGKEITTISIS